MKSISEETRKKMSESAKRRCENPEWIASQIARGTQLDEAAVRHMYENGMILSRKISWVGRLGGMDLLMREAKWFIILTGIN